MGWGRRAMVHGARCLLQQEAGTRVLICGGGPTGLSTALLLAKYGIPSVVLERHGVLPKHPKAHCINHRTMEIFRGMEPRGLAKDVKDAMPHLDQWRSFLYCSGSLLTPGSLLGVVDHFNNQCAQGDEVPYDPSVSPEPVAHVPQNRLVSMLFDRVQTFQDLIDVRMYQNVVSLEQDEVVRVGIEGPDGQVGFETGAYLVAADGAHSGIRRRLGITLDGAGTLQYLVNIHFTSPMLGRRLIDEHRMGMLYFIFGTKNIVVLVAHNLEKGEFVAQVPFFPPLQKPDDFDGQRCKEIVHDIAGFDVTDVTVLNAKPWAMGAAVATRYRQGNVFLAGDAAHIVPPSGAFGMNTGIQDAHNLAWKLALVLNQTFDAESLLQSYEAERKPIAIANMNLSVDNFHEALQVARIIGLDFDMAQSLNSVLNGPWSSWAPESVRKHMLNAAMSSGLLVGQALASARRKELEEIFSSGRTLRLQYPKEDVGFGYTGKDAYVYVEPEIIEAVQLASLPKPRDAPYAPCCLPGYRLPHVDLEVVHSSIGDFPSTTISSLDIADSVGTRFVLFIQHGTGCHWVQHLPSDYDSPVLVDVSIPTNSNSKNDGSETIDINDHTRKLCHIHVLLKDSDAILASEMSRLQEVFGGFPLGILVRPDGHIAWVGPPERVTSALERIFNRVRLN